MPAPSTGSPVWPCRGRASMWWVPPAGASPRSSPGWRAPGAVASSSWSRIGNRSAPSRRSGLSLERRVRLGQSGKRAALPGTRSRPLRRDRAGQALAHAPLRDAVSARVRSGLDLSRGVGRRPRAAPHAQGRVRGRVPAARRGRRRGLGSSPRGARARRLPPLAGRGRGRHVRGARSSGKKIDAKAQARRRRKWAARRVAAS